MKTRDKEIRDLVIKVRGYYDGIDERLTDALKEILRRLDKPDHIPGVGKKVEIEVVKIRALLEKASENISAARLDHGEYDQLNNASEKIWKVLALLKSEQCPKNIDTFCEKCGKVFVSSDDNTGTLCPDCQSQEPEHNAYAKDYPDCPHKEGETCWYGRKMNSGAEVRKGISAERGC